MSSLLQKFNKFYSVNEFKSVDEAVEFFSVFGGFKEKVDTSRSLMENIEKLILNQYKYLFQDIKEVTSGDELFSFVLSGAAQGDGQTHTAYKRAKVARQSGEDIVKELEKLKVITLRYSHLNTGSPKIVFETPFLKFWFAFISPLFKGIKFGDFTEVKKSFENNKEEFFSQLFEDLFREFLALKLEIKNVNGYWDESLSIGAIFKKEKDFIIADFKYTNQKLKKSELSKLDEKCKFLKIQPSMMILCTKKGFSKELKSLKNESLKLFTSKHLIC